MYTHPYSPFRNLITLRPLLILLGIIILGVAAQAQPSNAYAPRLQAPVFDVRKFGAKGDNQANDTEAIRKAIAEAEAAGGGTVYLPAGTYKVAPTGEGEFTFSIRGSNLTVEGDGFDRTILNFQAWDMQDPADLVRKRGGGFVTRVPKGGSIENVVLRGFRATGNAAPNEHAGQWWGDDSLRGWDVSHKGLGIWGRVDNLIVEDCEFDHWRGEVLYAGGGLELGRFTIRRTLVHHSNASAISMGGDVLIEDSEIYDVHNGTEMLSMGGHQKLVVRDTLIEPNRTLPDRIGKFGIVYLGFRESSLLVEGCTIRDTNSGAIFVSEYAHNVIIRDNTFIDTLAVYGAFLNLYKEFIAEKGFFNFEITGNRFWAQTRRVNETITFYSQPLRDWLIADNEIRGFNGNDVGIFLRLPGVHGSYIVKDNAIHNANPIHNNSGPRPIWINNTVTGRSAAGTSVGNYADREDTRPIVIEPTWPRVVISDLKDGVEAKTLTVNPAILPQLPSGFVLELRREGNRDGWEGVEIKPDSSWNNLSRGYMLYTGAVLKLRLDTNGKFSLDSFIPRTGTPTALTESGPSRDRDLHSISFQGFDEVFLEPAVPHIFDSFSGLGEFNQATIHLNENTILRHTPGVIETPAQADLVGTAGGSLHAINVGGVLRILSGDSPEALMAKVSTSRRQPVSFSLPSKDANGHQLTYRIVRAPGSGSIDLAAIPSVTYYPDPNFVGTDRILFDVSDGTELTLGAVELSVLPDDPFADNDGDGLPNLQEILFGSDPDDAQSRFTISISIEDGVVELLLPPVVAPNLEAVVQSSTDLVHWKDEEVITAETLLPAGFGQLALQFVTDSVDSPALFFRVLARIPE